ncbi:hypothetical protein DSCW_01900 [Desulfosarcina widdelii]|uniref:Uncharacterized protein n=1 Tax=Desulfosarcina widdelii TaxID=947919 RepID=A0A5K7YXX3_9BACT|nr:hypothetical protein [Desulfosarcina widdelii]BBO72773.1 hypothetical protein DSCW_01900 [Desulfosarcina widdelii]
MSDDPILRKLDEINEALAVIDRNLKRVLELTEGMEEQGSLRPHMLKAVGAK